MKRLLALTLVAAGLSWSPPVSAGPLELTGQVTVTGSRTAAVRVHAAKAFSLSTVSEFQYEARANPDVQISGRGRAIGVVLTQSTAQRRNRKSDNDGATLLLLRYGMCSGVGCAPVRGGVGAFLGFGPGVTGRDSRVTLPAGDYNLYLLTDGAPATARLTFHGLGGVSTLRPAAAAETHLAEALPTDPSGRRYLSDERHRFNGLGLMAVSRIGRSDVQSNPRTSYCLTRTTEEADNLTDPVDGETGCFSKLPTAVAGAEDPRNFHGKISASGNGGGTNWAAGGVDVFASFDPGVYRNYLTAEPTPFDDSHSFTTLWLPWR